MITNRDVVEAARAWRGTPFHWQASRRGVGCDCKGLVAGVARDLGLHEGASRFALMSDYGGRVDTDLLRHGMRELFDQVASPDALPGDLMILRIGGKPQHLAIRTTPRHMLHTYSNGPGCVIETAMGSVWRGALDSVWRWRGVRYDG